jgi:hypothetical protein
MINHSVITSANNNDDDIVEETKSNISTTNGQKPIDGDSQTKNNDNTLTPNDHHHHSESSTIAAAVGFQIQNFVIYVVSLTFFIAQWLFEFFMIKQSQSEHTYVFYTLLFYNLGSFAANFFWFFCHKRVARQSIVNQIEFLIIMLESCVYFCRHALRLISMYYIGCGITSSLLCVYVGLLILSDYVFDGVFSFYHKRRSSIVLVLSIVTVLPTFVHNESIYSQPTGVLLALCWVGCEALDTVIRYILEYSMTSYIASKDWCCFRKSRPSLTTASLLPVESVDVSASQIKCRNFNNYSIQWYNNVWGILLSLIFIFLFEIDQYENIMQQSEIVGYVTIATALYTISTITHIQYLNRVQRTKRFTATDPIAKSILMFTFFNSMFVVVFQVWQTVFQFISLSLFVIYFIIRSRDYLEDAKIHASTSALRFESDDANAL